jgi:predicted NBD/HSP70 family sugar kinase/biotin operon repressor
LNSLEDGNLAESTPTSGDSAAVSAARPRLFDFARGTNQIGVRLYNERLVLSLIRKEGSLPKAEIARQTGLSAQTITVIMRQLEADGLVLKQSPQRGKVGQPSVPFALNRAGAFAIGLKIGRRSNDLVLIDLIGGVRRLLHEAGSYPTPAGVSDFVARGITELTGTLSAGEIERICGLGIAAPFELWNWEEQIGVPQTVLEQWRAFDLKEAVAGMCPWPVVFCNDATAACAAELVLGSGAHMLDFLYFFIGSFVGGGLVLNGNLHLGRTGNAGAVGSMPIAATDADGGLTTQQLIRSASIYLLEQTLIEGGRDASILWRSPDDWGDLGAPLEAWIEQVAVGIAYATVAAVAVVDVPAVVIDGAFPASVRQRIVERVNVRCAEFDQRGLSAVSISEGAIGSGARAVGAACLPLLANFARDRSVLFKEVMLAN